MCHFNRMAPVLPVYNLSLSFLLCPFRGLGFSRSCNHRLGLRPVLMLGISLLAVYDCCGNDKGHVAMSVSLCEANTLLTTLRNASFLPLERYVLCLCMAQVSMRGNWKLANCSRQSLPVSTLPVLGFGCEVMSSFLCG